MSDDAPVPLLNCILNWQVTSQGDRVVGGSCYGFGLYRGVLFDTAFAVERDHLSEPRISELVRIAIDQMIAD